MKRIIDGYAYDRATDSQHNNAHTGLETSNDAQGEHSPHSNGNKNPEHILHPLVAEPQHQADKDQGKSQRQKRIRLDTAGILHRHFGTACRENLNRGIGPGAFFLEAAQRGQQFSVVGTLRTAVRRVKEEDLRILKSSGLSILKAV